MSSSTERSRRWRHRIVAFAFLAVAAANLIFVLHLGFRLADPPADAPPRMRTVRALAANGAALVILPTLAAGLLRRHTWAPWATCAVMVSHFAAVTMWNVSKLRADPGAGDIEWAGLTLLLAILAGLEGGVVALVWPRSR